MLDIRLIREQPDFVKSRIAVRGEPEPHAAVNEVLEVDAQRRSAETAQQRLNTQRNKISQEIGNRKRSGNATTELELQVREINREIDLLATTIRDAEQRQSEILLNVPSLPHQSVPVGDGPSDNVVVRSWGEKPALSGPVLDHVALGTKLKLFDLERAA